MYTVYLYTCVSMSDKHHITEKKYRGTKKWFSTITRAKKKKKKKSPMATAVQDENRKIISTGSF